MNDEILVKISICILIIVILNFIYILYDFYNDYQCSVTTEPNYWIEHNCIKYCRGCKNDK